MRVLLYDEEDDEDDDDEGEGAAWWWQVVTQGSLNVAHATPQDVTPRHSWAATSEESHHQAGVTKCYKVTQVVTLVLPSLKNWRLKNDIHGRELEPLKEEKPLQFVKKAKSTKVRFNTRDKKKLNCNAWVSTLQSEGEQVSPGNTHNLEHKN